MVIVIIIEYCLLFLKNSSALIDNNLIKSFELPYNEKCFSDSIIENLISRIFTEYVY